MPAHEQMIDALRILYWHHDPEAVFYINRMDGEGFKVEEVDGDFCPACAREKARELDKECGGKYCHEVCEESAPEDNYFRHCQECGCLLNSALITDNIDEDDIDCVIEDLKDVKEWASITGNLAWRLYSILQDEDTVKQQYPKKTASLTRRLTTLFKKTELYKED